MFAAKAGRTESTKILLKKSAQLAAKDLKGLTALHHAARNYQPKFIKMIIKQGMPVDIKDKKQLTALHHAISGMDQREREKDIRGENVSQLDECMMSDPQSDLTNLSVGPSLSLFTSQLAGLQRSAGLTTFRN